MNIGEVLERVVQLCDEIHSLAVALGNQMTFDDAKALVVRERLVKVRAMLLDARDELK